MRKPERATLIREKARQMAHTGDFGGWLIIEQMLRHRHGFPEARNALDDRHIRQQLDEICARARKRKDQPDV